MKTELPNIYEQAAGIDIGADKIFVCAKDGEYQVFRCFTEDFRKAAAYIKENGVSRVAMEATGVYWIALKDILEQEGLVVDVVKAGDAKQLPGRTKRMERIVNGYERFIRRGYYVHALFLMQR